MNITNDKSVIELASILECDLDIIGIAETHLRDNTIPQIDGYIALTHQQHRRARCGSGGVCLLVKNYINELYNVSILDNKTEDILWVQFVHQATLCHINVCMCYLPPDGSSRHIDPNEYFSNLLSQIYLNQDSGPYILCGDFNTRCDDQQDFIEESMKYNKTYGRSTLMLTGITGTTHTLYGRLFMVSPIEPHPHHKTAP